MRHVKLGVDWGVPGGDLAGFEAAAVVDTQVNHHAAWLHAGNHLLGNHHGCPPVDRPQGADYYVAAAQGPGQNLGLKGAGVEVANLLAQPLQPRERRIKNLDRGP